MNIDLLTERNMQLFMRLAGLAMCPVNASMSWNRSGYQTYLSYRQGRVHLSQMICQTQVEEHFLIQALEDWQPVMFAGIPQRIFQLCSGVVMSCSPPAESGAELWLLLDRRQRSFLDNLCIPI